MSSLPSLPRQLPLFGLERLCNGCQRVLPVTADHFDRCRDGFQTRCKQCRALEARRYRERQRETPKRVPPHKHCRRCARDLPSTSFYPDHRTPCGLSAHCRECVAAYRAAHAERHRAYIAVWTPANRERLRAHKHAYYERTKEQHRAQRALWYRRNVASIKAAAVAWNRAHPLLRRVQSQRRRARVRRAPGSHTIHDVRQLYEQQEGRCAYCAVELDGLFHIDHKIPLSRPGTSNDPSNLCLACGPCNMVKQDRTDDEFRAWRASLA